MIIIRNNILPFKGYCAMNICGLLFVRKDVKLTDVIVNHEDIHTAQMRETFYIGFYVIYVLNWLYNLFRYRFDFKEAYRNILFEKEAYQHEYYILYLYNREPFTWLYL